MLHVAYRRSRRRKPLPRVGRASSKVLESSGYKRVRFAPLGPSVSFRIRNDWARSHIGNHSLTVFADISELNLARGTTIEFPEGKDKLLKFEITIRPDEGIYRCIESLNLPSYKHYVELCAAPPTLLSARGGAFKFFFDISPGYPHDAPKVKCKTKVPFPCL